MKKHLYYFAFTSALTFTVSCGDMVTVHRINHIGLYDLSQSVDEPSFIGYVNVYMNSIFKNLSLDDATINLPIDEASQSQASQMFYRDFAGMNFLGKDNIVTHADDSIRTRFSRFKEEQFPIIIEQFKKVKADRTASSQNTDIIRCLLNVQKFLSHDSANSTTMNLAKAVTTGKKEYKTTNLITINSDMINDEPGESPYDMMKFAPLNREKIDRLLDNLEVKNMIANLAGCYIIVNGATTHGKTANELYENISYFWSEYFERTKANLLFYGYDSGLQIEKFMKDFKR